MNSPSAADQVPRLANYELLDELGHGGMATVYRARDPRLDREVAIKIIHPHLRENAEVAARFTSEAKAVAKLRHPNIVEVFDVSREEDDERFLVVELVRGTTLRKVLQAHRELPAEIAALLVLEVAKALEHAHSHGVVHRDIKPENVLVAFPERAGEASERRRRAADRSGVEWTPSAPDTTDGVAAESGPLAPRVKLTDFGIAKVLDAQGVTSTGQVLGSPAHMAPEQIEGGDVDERADVFGIGVLLYETMVGKLPFHGKNPAQVLRRVLDGLYEPAVHERPSVGAAWSAVLDRALAKLPEDRFQSVAELAAAMRQILEELKFASGERELALYFAAPDAYQADYVERIVGQLSSTAKRARAAGDVVGASQLFNRALAFKPGDPELLRQISGLARRAQLKRAGLRGGAILLGSLALGSIAFAVTRVSRGPEPPRVAHHEAAVTSASSVEAKIRAEKIEPGAAPSASAKVGKRLPRFVPKFLGPKPEASAGAVQAVQVVISGASGTASVDGTPLRFGQIVKLPPGNHTFAFKATDETCCVADPASRVVAIKAQPETQVVYGHIKIRDATLSVSGGPAGSIVYCPQLFKAGLRSPGQRQIAMGSTAMSLTAACTLKPPPDSGAAEQTKSVRVVAGQVSTLSF